MWGHGATEDSRLLAQGFNINVNIRDVTLELNRRYKLKKNLKKELGQLSWFILVHKISVCDEKTAMYWAFKCVRSNNKQTCLFNLFGGGYFLIFASIKNQAAPARKHKEHADFPKPFTFSVHVRQLRNIFSSKTPFGECYDLPQMT